MEYYIYTIEQYTNDGAYVEGAKMYYNTKSYDTALMKFYSRLAEVANSPVHNFLDIKIVQSDGGIVKKDVYGAYVNPDKIVKPTEG